MIRAFQWDLARQVERLDVLLGLLPHYAAWGYQELYLHLEDAVTYPSFPAIARGDAYSRRQMAKLVEAAMQVGIKVVPIVNLLGHTQYLIKTSGLRELNELRDDNGSPLDHGQICPLHPGTMEVAEKLLRDAAPYCTAGKVHVGLDESFHIGRCPRCRAEIARIGLAQHFAGHVGRLHAVTRFLGLRMGLWADMLNFIPEAIPLLPASVVAYDWYYYPFKRHPRVEFFNFAENDLATPLRARGIEYWGCPMNGAFRYEPLPIFSDRLANLRSWWQRCNCVGAAGFLVTSWEACRLALETTTVVDAAAASLWLDGQAPDNDLDWLAQGFGRVFGRSGARTAAKTALASDRYPFAGYARWEINARWDGVSTRDSAAPFRKERGALARLARQKTPEPLAAGLAFRRYLADRDVFVRECVEGVRGLRTTSGKDGPPGRPSSPARPAVSPYLGNLAQLETAARAFSSALAAGRRAARAMWRRTRDPKAGGQNETILDADAARLRSWRDWLRACRKHPAHVWNASPVFGAWQLQFVVHNFAPAVQKIVVEQQAADGTWSELANRHTIEFRAGAARPRADIRRPFAVPVESPEAVLRISIQGIGRVAIEQIELTNGAESLIHADRHKRHVLGRPAPRRGFPDPGAVSALDAALLLRLRATHPQG